MFKIESYVTPILLSYVDKYVRDFNPANAQVSLWGGGVALHNLVLKPDVLQQEVALPFTLISGRIHELLIQVPWTKIMSEPIIVTIDTIECVLNLKPPQSPDESPPPASPSHKTQVVEAPPGYMQALVRRIVSNIALRVHHLIVKYVQDDIVLSLNVKHLSIDSAGVNWEPAFADIDQHQPTVRRLVRLDDLTLCLDKADADGKIRYYQEPLLYRCHLDFRVLTQLVSANCRRASSLRVTLRSSKLAFSVTSDQLMLLLRLMKERAPTQSTQQPSKSPAVHQPPIQLPPTKANSSDSTRSNNSWSEWAWSWLPTWMDKEGGLEDIPVSPTPLPVTFDAFLDDLSLVFKIMELVEGHSRRRARAVIEVGATHAALTSALCAPTSLGVRFGARDLSLQSHGRCVCGVSNYEDSNHQATKYLKRVDFEEKDSPWVWPEEVLSEPTITNHKIEMAQAATEGYFPPVEEIPEEPPTGETVNEEEPPEPKEEAKEPEQAPETLFDKMQPLIYVEFAHDRSPPSPNMNPYDNPPKDFQYSDWVEQCRIRVKLEPLEVRLCMGLVHRLMAFRAVFKEAESVPREVPMRVLTVEECDSLTDNLPERRISIEGRGLRVRLHPWNHHSAARPMKSPIVLGLDLPTTTVSINGPLYPHRVCSAACQIPDDVGPLWQGARLHITAVVKDAQMLLTTVDNSLQKPCARADIHVVMHVLLNKSFFSKKESVHISHLTKIREMNISGSWARLHAAYCALESLFKDQVSVLLNHSSLPRDALHDEDAVVLDFTLEEFVGRAYVTKNIKTIILSLQSAKATAFHEPVSGEVKQAWLISAPDAPTTTPYFRLAFQWCDETGPKYFDYLGFWAEATSVSIDPLFIAWLAYKPVMKANAPSTTSTSMLKDSQYLKRKLSWSSSTGVRARGASELVHVRPRASLDSGSEPSDRKLTRNTLFDTNWWYGDKLLCVVQRLGSMLLHVEMGLVQVYVSTESVCALDCATLRDAIDRHALAGHRVLAISLGRIAMHSNAANKHLWQTLRHDGPTFLKEKIEAESFPWKMRIADVSCYTLEAAGDQRDQRDHSGSALRSTLKAQAGFAAPRTLLELVTTTVTVSIVTKAIQIKNIELVPPSKKHMSMSTQSEKSKKTKYFTEGVEFKPTTLKEFFRGPQRRSTRQEKEKIAQESKLQAEMTQSEAHEKVTVREGPLVSLGVQLHADTPPIIVKLERDQIHVVAAAIHCFMHIITLLKQEKEVKKVPSQLNLFGQPTSSSRSFLPRSVSEQENLHNTSEDSASHSSELIEIFDRDQEAPKKRLTTFFWCQWVVSHATLIVASSTVKLAFNIDDIISTVELQPHYNQLKMKLASASVRHYELNVDDEWTPGAMRGRVLEAREAPGSKDEDQFLAVTITQAHLSLLPDSWKQELHPKLLEKRNGEDVMWEIYAILAPLEALIQPVILDNITSMIKELMPREFCPMQEDQKESQSSFNWPFCYLSAGGMRLLVTAASKDSEHDTDDTFVFNIEKVTMNPHPENPICRRLVGNESGWLGTPSNYEGQQYEVTVKSFDLRTGRFSQFINEETNDTEMTTNSNVPAVKWNQVVEEPLLTPFLYPIDICFVLAPPLFTREALTCGPAIEVNILTDCVIEVSIEQFVLWEELIAEMQEGMYTSTIHMGTLFEESAYGVCPYAELLNLTSVESPDDGENIVQEDSEVVIDSGVETIASHSTYKLKSSISSEIPLRKTVSILLSDPMALASDNVEVYLTMGAVDISLFVKDDDSPEVMGLRTPFVYHRESLENSQMAQRQTSDSDDAEESSNSSSNRSITDVRRRQTDIGGRYELQHFRDGQEKRNVGYIPLLQATLQQPNLYYYKKKDMKNLQVSLFDARAALGVGEANTCWKCVLISTAKGTPDPTTDIPPALATLKIVVPNSTAGGQYSSTSVTKGSVQLDIERPVQLELSTDSFKRLISIQGLLMNKLVFFESDGLRTKRHDTPLIHNLHQLLVRDNIESVVVQTSQMAVCGGEGSVAWSALSVQAGAGARPQRATARALLTALVVASGPASDTRHVLLHPLIMGAEVEVSWEAWRRAEGGPVSREPSVSVSVEMGRVIADLRPSELGAWYRLQRAAKQVLQFRKDVQRSNYRSSTDLRGSLSRSYTWSASALRVNEDNKHYYKDDLRSGAFQMVSGGQMPMAYQILLRGNAVAWRYPHPRAITRIVAYPLPGMDKETDCVLELFCPILGTWETHTYFKIPVGEPREINIQHNSPDAVFATLWRFRACERSQPTSEIYEFEAEKFTPKSNPLVSPPVDDHLPKCACPVTAEQLSGILRVDSYFAPQMLPRIQLVVRCAETELHIHNALPSFTSQATAMEGYYVSRPLMRSHRVLSLYGKSSKYHFHFGTNADLLAVVNTTLSADILDCSTGTMEELMYDFLLQAGVTRGAEGEPRVRAIASPVHVGLHVARLRTIQTLVVDWKASIDKYILKKTTSETDLPEGLCSVNQISSALEGRVSLWVHNNSNSALRIGQEGTDEVVPLGPGVRLAYRWRCPTSPKRLRLALANPTALWHWSSSLSFTPGATRVKLTDPTSEGKEQENWRNLGMYVHVKVEETGGKRNMQLCGRLQLANMLRFRLIYKVRARADEAGQWRTVSSDEMEPEHIGRSVICSADAEMVLKIKFLNHDSGWSGDIPLRECPKENVPWLVKVPSEGDMAYISVWCRVVRARSDGRVMATVWPLYVLHSHLPLDTDVLIVTETSSSSTKTTTTEEQQPAPLIQSTPGRGNCTHLLAPGTTANKHSLSFQYRNIQCPVTREAVPLHYGVTDVSVFDKRTPVVHIEEVIQETTNWLKRAGRTYPPSWPYSVVSKHYDGIWQAALMQPRCDVTVRYQAIRAGGGCALEVQLCPVVLLCNAAPLALTLRAHDAAPLCVLKSGTSISPPSAILTKPFFMSVEIGRETFVSEQLQVSGEEPGRYGRPQPGHVTLDHATNFSVLCNNKVALLTMHYEIKEDINVFGITSSYVIINRLDVDLQVSAIAAPCGSEHVQNLRVNTFKVVKPTKAGSVEGTALCRFFLRGRWRGGSWEELHKFVCLALSSDCAAQSTPVPVRLDEPPVRRAIALLDDFNTSVPVTVTQIRQDGRCVIVVAPDSCPQFLVHNMTTVPMAVAQPLPTSQEQPSTSKVNLSEECPGAQWWCVVPAGAALHYSTPLHCARYPPLPPPAPPLPAAGVPLLSFGKLMEYAGRVYHEWSAPVAVTGGEQLIPFYGGVTVKLCVSIHPHSSLLVLKDTEEHDISASDIRRRLHAIARDSSLLDVRVPKLLQSRKSVERVTAMSRLYEAPSEYLLPIIDSQAEVSNSQARESNTQPGVSNIQAGISDNLAAVSDNKARVSNMQTEVLTKIEEASDNVAEVSDNQASVSDSQAGVSNKKSEVSDNQAGTSNNLASVTDSKAGVSNTKTTISDNQAGVSDNLVVEADNLAGVSNNLSRALDTKAKVSAILMEILNNTARKLNNKVGASNQKAEVSDNQASVTDNKTGVSNTKASISDNLLRVSHSRVGVLENQAGVLDLQTGAFKSQAGVSDNKTEGGHREAKVLDTHARVSDTYAKASDTNARVSDTNARVSVHRTKESINLGQVSDNLTEISDNQAEISDRQIVDTSEEKAPVKPESAIPHSNICDDTKEGDPSSLPQIKEQSEDNKVIRDSEVLDPVSTPANPEVQEAAAGSPASVMFADHVDSEINLRRKKIDPKMLPRRSDINMSRPELAFHKKSELNMETLTTTDNETVRCVITGLVIKMATNADEAPLFALHLDRTAALIICDKKKTRAILSVADIQIDNLQYESGHYDFAVVASTRAAPPPPEPWPPLWSMFSERAAFSTRHQDASLVLKLHQEKWTVVSHKNKEITELELRLGSLALYIEDAYVTALLELSKLVLPSTTHTDAENQISEENSLQNPLRLRLLYIHPLNLTLTLHTAVRMYIALDQSPLRLSAFKLHDMMTSSERLTHALTVHYLSAAILGAGWVVGGLELLGAPGAIAARLGEATGGVKGVASATAAALLRSLSAWAGSLARNLDLLAGDEEHARRAAAARRKPPTNLMAGLVAGITNFAINILGAVGGLAHHPLVGVAVGETDSSAAALRRGLLGALTKPLSATADLVAYAGHGLLRQTGWDPVLEPRSRWANSEARETANWRRDCVRWSFRLGELHALSGFEVMLDNSPLLLLVTHKYLVVADPESERIVEMIDHKSCTLFPYQGQIVQLSVSQGRKSSSKTCESRAPDEDDEYQISAAAMARVARYTGTEGQPSNAEYRLLSLLSQPGRDHSLYAVLATVLNQDPATHLSIL